MNFLKFAFFCFAASVFAGPLLINQLGFNPESEKFALVPGSDANDAEIRDMDGKTILKIKAPLV